MNVPVVPFTGLLRELLMTGLAQVMLESGFSESWFSGPRVNERVAAVLKGIAEGYEEKLKSVVVSRVERNDDESYFKVGKGSLVTWYGLGDKPTDYLRLMLYVLRGTAKLLESGSVDFARSVANISIGRKISFGVAFKNQYAIVPAPVKQAEFYEKQTEFLRPTTGKKPEVQLDPIWFALLAAGFLLCFGGYYNKSYYFFVKEGVEDYIYDPVIAGKILDGIRLLTKTNMEARPTPVSEELYEMRLALGLAESGSVVEPEAYPFKMYAVKPIGRAYTCTRTLDINLRELEAFMRKYREYIERVLIVIGFDPRVKIGKEETVDNPLKAMLELASRELKSRVEGDNTMLVYIFVKDLYRAINSGDPRVIEFTVFRLARTGIAVLQAKGNISVYLKITLQKFLSEKHLVAILETAVSARCP